MPRKTRRRMVGRTDDIQREARIRELRCLTQQVRRKQRYVQDA